MRSRSALAVALVSVLALGACNSGASPSGSAAGSVVPATAGATSNASSAPATPLASAGASVAPSEAAGVSAECMAGTVQTTTDGKLTVSTDNPAFPPWFGGKPPKGSDWASFGGYPPNGQGFESAIAYAIAAKLGFPSPQVDWVMQSAFGQAFKPGDKDFDFHVGQVSYKPKRAQAVDFSDSYFDISQGIVALADNPIAQITTVTGLKDFQLGAPVGTTSFDAIEQVIMPTKEAKVYDDVDKGVTALKNGQIDGLVADLPTAYIIRDAELKNGAIVGQLPPTGGQQEYFGAVLQKDSPLTDCVNQAIAAIKADGTWQTLYDQYIGATGSAPILK